MSNKFKPGDIVLYRREKAVVKQPHGQESGYYFIHFHRWRTKTSYSEGYLVHGDALTLVKPQVKCWR